MAINRCLGAAGPALVASLAILTAATAIATSGEAPPTRIYEPNPFGVESTSDGPLILTMGADSVVRPTPEARFLISPEHPGQMPWNRNVVMIVDGSSELAAV